MMLLCRQRRSHGVPVWCELSKTRLMVIDSSPQSPVVRIIPILLHISIEPSPPHLSIRVIELECQSGLI